MKHTSVLVLMLYSLRGLVKSFLFSFYRLLLLRPLPRPELLPRPRPILTGFNPVTFSASNADSTDSALSIACAFPDFLAASTSSLAFWIALLFDSVCCAASSTNDCSTQDRQRAFPSPLFHWFLLNASAFKLSLHFAHLRVSSLTIVCLEDAAFRSCSSVSATHFLHFNGPPVLRCLSSALISDKRRWCFEKIEISIHQMALERIVSPFLKIRLPQAVCDDMCYNQSFPPIYL